MSRPDQEALENYEEKNRDQLINSFCAEESGEILNAEERENYLDDHFGEYTDFVIKQFEAGRIYE